MYSYCPKGRGLSAGPQMKIGADQYNTVLDFQLYAVGVFFWLRQIAPLGWGIDALAVLVFDCSSTRINRSSVYLQNSC